MTSHSKPSPTFGLTSEQWRILDKLLLEPLRKENAAVFVFGSRARGDHQKFSDLDLLIERSPPLSLAEFSDFRERLEECALPIKVDLVDGATLAESYRKQIQKERVRI